MLSGTLQKNRKECTDKIILFILSIIAFFSNLGVKSADIMEARNFITAREMVQYGNWLIPTMNGAYRFEKPPLPTWLTAFTMKIFNDTSSEWILRIPAALTSVLLVFLIYGLVKIITKNSQKGFLAALVTLSIPFLLEEGIANTWDIFTYVYAFGFIYFILKYIKEEKSKGLNYILSIIFLGLSIMCKGPVAIYGLILPFFISYLAIFGYKEFKGKVIKIILAVILGLIIGASWYIYMILLHKELFLSVMAKEVNTWDSRSVQGFFFYFNYLSSTGGWILFLLGSYFIPWNVLKEKKEYKFSLIWFIGSLLLISFIKMKKDRYAIPLFLISPLVVSTLLNYYCESTRVNVTKKFKDIFNKSNSLNNIDRLNSFIFYAQYLFLWGVTLVSPILYLIRGYKPKFCGLNSAIFYFVISFIFLGVLTKTFKERNNRTSNSNFKILILLTTVIGIFSFSIKYRLMEFSKMKKQKEKISNLKVLHDDKNGLELYSQEVYANHVWESGHRINTKLDNLPEEFIYIGVEEELKKSKLSIEEFLKSKNELKEYEIIDKKEFYTFKSGSSKSILVHMRKQKKN